MDIVKVVSIVAPLIREMEGLRLTAYQDTGGVWTIGYGHTKGVTEGMTIKTHEAELLLLEDLAEAVSHTLQTVPELAFMPESRIAAIVDFTFNLGAGRLRASTLCRVLRYGQLDRVPSELRRWVYGTVNGEKVQLRGLVRRREAECSLWEKGTHYGEIAKP